MSSVIKKSIKIDDSKKAYNILKLLTRISQPKTAVIDGNLLTDRGKF